MQQILGRVCISRCSYELPVPEILKENYGLFIEHKRGLEKKRKEAAMLYSNIRSGIFIERLNRFIAKVQVDGKECQVHVRNTGRCKEILVAGAAVILEESGSPDRKTKFTLIAVYKGAELINIDSLAPNQVVFEHLVAEGLGMIGRVDNAKREVIYGNSRFDICFETQGRRGFIEVKGVTLEDRGIAMFPDAPTLRGAKHLAELTQAAAEGYTALIVFLVQMKGVTEFKPNGVTDPNFALALRLAEKHGVGILAFDSLVEPEKIELGNEVKVVL
jgi:sugar fermentation stimulation protein A